MLARAWSLPSRQTKVKASRLHSKGNQAVRFTLVYQGELPPRGSSKDKWRIRRGIEPQLRQLWDVPPFDSIAKYKDPSYQPDTCYVGMTRGGFEYIPYISTKLDLRAELRIRLLSSSMPGGLVHSGDIDNRLQTLLDALSVPSAQQVPDNADADPDGRVFCLLEDDRLVTRIDVTNDRLLSVPENSRETIVLVDVRPVAHIVTSANIGIST